MLNNFYSNNISIVMLGQFFSKVAGFISKEAFGSGMLSTVARFAGKALGNYLEQIGYEPEIEEIYKFKKGKDSFSLSVAEYGEVIPLIFGKGKIKGKIIWAKNIREETYDTEENIINSATNNEKIIHNIQNNYFISLAVCICEGEILDMVKVWMNEELINLDQFCFRLYKGTDTQGVDALIAADSPEGFAPAFRDLAYIVFEEMNLSCFNNQIPSFAFEVLRRPNICENHSVEEQVKSMVIIPGCGEYVYDTVMQYKYIKTLNDIVVGKEKINSHNYYNIPNSVHSLNQLQLICPNLEWVAPVVCWFGNNLDIANCSILPAVEFCDDNIGYSEEWRVGNYERKTARLISQDAEGNPQYGGSINDNSVIRYLEEIKRRNLKIMFYPMFFLDLEGKPWRGHLTGRPCDVVDFFQKDDGYNNFILHYANLVKNRVDGFVIGSELIGLTKIKDESNNFPAVNELVNLAARVKAILGSNVLVTYAADWSEYHHTAGGWYNLDPLWSSPYIDFIGIDAYFPVTKTLSSNISYEEIVKGFKEGEGYDYYLDENMRPQALDKKYAWKDIKYWWENRHYNPNSEVTSWIPKSKKFWFTEFGFPSIDKASNKPNVFFDPNCYDGGKPTFSSGEVDFTIQRKSIKGFIQYWEREEYIVNMFLWTWDARSSPAWPFMDIWRDGNLWEKGHWVNDKFGCASIANIILELSSKCNIENSKVNVSQLDEVVNGLIISKPLRVLDIINILRITHFFDLKTTTYNEITFSKRAENSLGNLSNKRLIKISKNSYLEIQQIAKLNIINKLHIFFIDYQNNYSISYVCINSEYLSAKTTPTLRLPILLTAHEVKRIGDIILKNAQRENQILRFIISANSFEYEPGDIILLEYLKINYQLRIIQIIWQDLFYEITAIIDDIKTYYSKSNAAAKSDFLQFSEEIDFRIIKLPLGAMRGLNGNCLVAYLDAKKSYDLSYNFAGINSQFFKLKKLKAAAVLGALININHDKKSNIYLIDEISTFIIHCKNFNTNTNTCLLGNEIIQFKKWEECGQNLYKLSHLIRGVSSTEQFMDSHMLSEDVILLEINFNIIEITNNLTNKKIFFKVHDKFTEFSLANFHTLPPPYIKSYHVAENNIMLEIIDRYYDEDFLISKPTPEVEFEVAVKNNMRSYKFNTCTYKILIETNQLDLSEAVNINIITKDRLGNFSLPSCLTIK